MFVFVFAFTVEDIQVWLESVRTRFRKLTRDRLEDGTLELADHDKYILEKLQFLERHITHVSRQPTCSVSVKFKHQHNCCF